MKKYVYQGKDKISIDESCRTCEFNFDKICAGGRREGQERIGNELDYGEEIKDIAVQRDCWEGPSFDYFVSLSKRLEKKNNSSLVVKVEDKLGFDFGLIKGVGKSRKPVFFIDAKLRGWELESVLLHEVRGRVRAIKSGDKKESERLEGRIFSCMNRNKIKWLAVKVEEKSYIFEIENFKEGKNLAVGFDSFEDFKESVKV